MYFSDPIYFVKDALVGTPDLCEELIHRSADIWSGQVWLLPSGLETSGNRGYDLNCKIKNSPQKTKIQFCNFRNMIFHQNFPAHTVSESCKCDKAEPEE